MMKCQKGSRILSKSDRRFKRVTAPLGGVSAESKNPSKYILNILYHNPAIIWVFKRSIEAEIMPGLWQTVCGKIEPNEGSAEACLRETSEKAGIDLMLRRIRKIFNDL